VCCVQCRPADERVFPYRPSGAVTQWSPVESSLHVEAVCSFRLAIVGHHGFLYPPCAPAAVVRLCVLCVCVCRVSCVVCRVSCG
jgi:hypothetical protein